MLSSLRAVTSLSWENLSGGDRWEHSGTDALSPGVIQEICRVLD